MKKDLYFGSGWFSPEQEENYETITKILKDKGFTLFEPRYDVGTGSGGPLTLEKAREIFKGDIDGITQCKALFADISFSDKGVLVEIGVALANNIPVILFDNSSRKVMNVMLAGSAKNCLRTFEDVEAFANGEDVFNLGEDIEFQ